MIAIEKINGIVDLGALRRGREVNQGKLTHALKRVNKFLTLLSKNR